MHRVADAGVSARQSDAQEIKSEELASGRALLAHEFRLHAHLKEIRPAKRCR
jgi:hypothetical protein